VESPQHRRRQIRPVRLVLAAFKGAALGALLTLVVVGGLHMTAPSAQPGATAESDASQRVVERAVADHHCSYAGFGGKVLPSSALIRTSGGTLRQVSFAVGWDVYNGKRPGTLIAVCLDQPDGTGLVRTSNQ
jgi:hypothetical protein